MGPNRPAIFTTLLPAPQAAPHAARPPGRLYEVFTILAYGCILWNPCAMLLRETLESVLATPGGVEAAGDELTRRFQPAWKAAMASHALVLTGIRR